MDGSDKVVVFGGFEEGCRVNSVRAFNLETHTWTLQQPKDPLAPRPSPRAGHSATVHGSSMYIFGGKDDDNRKLNDLWRYDLSN